MQIRYRSFRTGPRFGLGPQASGMPSASAPGMPTQTGLGAGFTGNTPGLALDAFLYPPPNSTTLFGTDFAPSVGPNTLVPLPGTQLTTPLGNVGVVNSATLLLDGITAASVVQWQLLVNGVVTPGYSNLRVIPRSGAASVSLTISPIRVVMAPGASAVLQAINIDGAAYNVGGQLYGWFWPVATS